MKKLLKYSLVVFLIICGVLIAVTVLLHFIDLDRFRPRIQNIASRMIGREIHIKGHLDINLFPHPEVILNDVSLANADWSTEPVMANVGHLDATIRFWSLISGPLVVSRVHLNDVTLLLEKNDQQVGNWTMGGSTPRNATKEKIGLDLNKDLRLPLIVELAELRNITVSVRTPGTTDQIYHLEFFNLRSNEKGNLILESSGELVGKPMSLEGTLISKASLNSLGPVKADLKATLLDAELTGQLSTTKLATLADLHGEIRINVADIRKTLQMVQIKAPFGGPFTADVTVKSDGSVYGATVKAMAEGITATANASLKDNQVDITSTLTPLKRVGELFGLQGLSADALNLKAKLSRSGAKDIEIKNFQTTVGKSHLAAQGRISMDGKANLSIDAASQDLRALFNKLPVMDIKATASVRYSKNNLAVSDLMVNFKKSNLKGDLTVITGDKKNISAKFRSELLDLRPFELPAKKKSVKKKAPGKSQYIFKQDPIPIEPLKTIEADLKLSVDHFYYDQWEYKNAEIDAAAHGGHAKAKIKFDSANGGHAAAKVDLKIRGQQMIIDTLASVSDFRLTILPGEGIRPEDTPPVSVSLELKTAGASPRQMASVANGKVLFTSGPGKTNSALIKRVTGDIIDQLLGALNPFSKKEEFFVWNCSMANVNIEKGFAKIDTLLAQAEKVMIVGTGDVDLKTERLNIEFNTKPRSGVGVHVDMFVTPFIKLGGTLAKPAMGLNKKGTLITGGAAVATGGLSFLIKGLFDRAAGEVDYCEKVKEEVGKHTPFDF